MAKGESQKRLSLSTIERSLLLFMGKKAKEDGEIREGIQYAIEFVWFLEQVNDEGLPKIKKRLLEPTVEFVWFLEQVNDEGLPKIKKRLLEPTVTS